MQIHVNKKYLTKIKCFGIGFTIMFGLSTAAAVSEIEENDNIYSNKPYQGIIKIKDDVYIEDSSGFSDLDIENLSSDIRCLRISKNSFISDLSKLPEVCPNLVELNLGRDINISDFSFVKELKKLERLNVCDNPYITKELVLYCQNNNISLEYNEEQLEYSQKLDAIIDEIITPEMSDIEKIHAITMYITNEYDYNTDLAVESNNYPLGCLFENQAGVCTSYSWIADVLLNKCGIKTYICINKTHVWNIVELNDKYYYLDTIYIDSTSDTNAFRKMLFENFKISTNFLIDPGDIKCASHPAYDSGCVSMPEELVEDIKKGEDLKNIFEKYHNTYEELFAISILFYSMCGGATCAMTAYIVENLGKSKNKTTKL